MNLVMEPVNALVNLIKKKAFMGIQVAEVGTFQGETTIAYAPFIKAHHGHMFLVDWFEGGAGVSKECATPHYHQPENKDKIYENLRSNLAEIDCLDCATIFRGDSAEMAQHIEDESLDICFIDAAHTYSKVLKDINAYLPKVKSGGLLCGHDMEGYAYVNKFTQEQLDSDYSPDLGMHAGVIQAVFERFGTDISISYGTGGQSPHIPIWIKQV